MSDDIPSDIVSITPSMYNFVNIQSELFSGEIGSRLNDDLDVGIDVHHDGPDIGIAAGTNWNGGEMALESYHGLTVEQAREIADALNEAADAAEEAQSENGAKPEPQTFLQRIMNNV